MCKTCSEILKNRSLKKLEQSGELKVKVVKADGVEGTRCNVEVTDFEKLDQKLDIMLGAYTGNTDIKSIKLKLAGWLQKVVDWLK